MRALAGLLLICSVTACHGAQASAPVAVAVGTPQNSRDFSRFSYAGKWEFVNARGGGASGHRTARSFHSGDTLTLLYDGAGFRLYGITGPNGGIGTVVLPGQAPAQINFHATQRHVHVLLYSSPALAPGVHSAAVVVTKPAGKERGYVNVDDVQVYGRTALIGFSRDGRD